MKSKLRSAGFVALVLAGLSWLAEKAFYGEIDANGVVQESFFLPVKPPKSGPRFRRFYKSFPVLAGAYQGLGAVGCDCTA